MQKDIVLIVDDDKSIREMLELILKQNYDVITAESGEEALTKSAGVHPSVALLDIRLPGISGIETLERLLKRDTEIKCLMISMLHDPDTVVECMRKGAHDFMTKELEYESVLWRVRNAMTLARLRKAYNELLQKNMRSEGESGRLDRQKIEEDIVLPDDNALKRTFRNWSAETIEEIIASCPKGKNLTGQERNVLGLILKGLSNKDIAKELHVGLTTVKAHLKNAYQKLGVTTRAQAISYLLLKRLFKDTHPPLE